MGSEAEGFIPDVSWCESVYLYMPHHVQNLCICLIMYRICAHVQRTPGKGSTAYYG